MSREKPTDLELMMYADGELQGDRLAAVEAFLAADAASQKKILALDLATSLVRESADEIGSSADDIADLVMASVAKDTSGASDASSKPSSEAPVLARQGAAARAANDNGRRLAAFAAIAVAAAAAFAVWTRASTPDVEATPTPPHMAEHADTSVAKAPTVDSAKAPREVAVADSHPGVEVSTVDFGAHVGALFYVPTGAAATEVTTVVWLSDDSTGGDE
jgi:anti-sigma factor RsiW